MGICPALHDRTDLQYRDPSIWLRIGITVRGSGWRSQRDVSESNCRASERSCISRFPGYKHRTTGHSVKYDHLHDSAAIDLTRHLHGHDYEQCDRGPLHVSDGHGKLCFNDIGSRAAFPGWHLEEFEGVREDAERNGGITTVFKNGSAKTVTCTLGTGTSCQDLTHTFTTVSNDQVVIKIASAGGAVTGGPTYASGSSACTNGTQIVTFTNNTSGTNATGTITITATVPVGAVTMTTGGTGYASGTPPTTGTIATCTGTATFTGGTVTVDALGDIFATVEVQ